MYFQCRMMVDCLSYGWGGGFKFRILCIPNAISRKFPTFLKRHFIQCIPRHVYFVYHHQRHCVGVHDPYFTYRLHTIAYPKSSMHTLNTTHTIHTMHTMHTTPTKHTTKSGLTKGKKKEKKRKERKIERKKDRKKDKKEERYHGSPRFPHTTQLKFAFKGKCPYFTTPLLHTDFIPSHTQNDRYILWIPRISFISCIPCIPRKGKCPYFTTPLLHTKFIPWHTQNDQRILWIPRISFISCIPCIPRIPNHGRIPWRRKIS